MAPRPKPLPSDVFINAPFDKQYEPIFLATIAGLVGLGLNPRCVLEIPASHDRLTRLLAIVGECPFSLHDLSRVELSGAGRLRCPRFNMPFELGLAATVALQEGGTHEWRLLEAIPHRLTRSLSDVNGYDPSIHEGTASGMMEGLLDIFDKAPHPPLHRLEDLLWVYHRLRRFRNKLLPSNMYKLHAFRKLVLTARGLVAEKTASVSS